MSFSGENRSERTEMVPIQLPNGAIAKIEIARNGGREDVAFGLKQFEDVGTTIEGIVEVLSTTIQKAAPSKATIKFGLEVEVEQGSLVAAIVRGKGKTHLEITLEWTREMNQKDEENLEEEESSQ
jgi:hypothetical protein